MALMLALTCSNALNWNQYMVASACTMHQVPPEDHLHCCRSGLLTASHNTPKASAERHGCPRRPENAPCSS